jgi:hypothetical protein
MENEKHKTVPLTAGVVIIGSLLWDPDPIREAWRGSRLITNSPQAITVPIRYGRLSSSRGNSYTMVFSRSADMGKANLVVCSHLISSVSDLVTEAQHLWNAEQPRAVGGRIASGWGCVALLSNPERTIPEHILKGWAERVGQEPSHGRVSQTEEEGRLIADDGLLQIPWPRSVDGDEPVQCDLLLATANDPGITARSPCYPSVAMIADAWNRSGHYVKYFWKNVENGIQTFQDDEIRARLLAIGKAGV